MQSVGIAKPETSQAWCNGGTPTAKEGIRPGLLSRPRRPPTPAHRSGPAGRAPQSAAGARPSPRPGSGARWAGWSLHVGEVVEDMSTMCLSYLKLKNVEHGVRER